MHDFERNEESEARRANNGNHDPARHAGAPTRRKKGKATFAPLQCARETLRAHEKLLIASSDNGMSTLSTPIAFSMNRDGTEPGVN